MVTVKGMREFSHAVWSDHVLESFWELLDFIYVQCSPSMSSTSRDEVLAARRSQRAVQLDPCDPFSPYRRCGYVSSLVSELDLDVKTAADIPVYAARQFGDYEAFGTREVLSYEDEVQHPGKTVRKYSLGDYQWTSYERCLEYIYRIGDGFHSIGLKPQDSVIFFCETRFEWLMCLMACFMNSIRVITLYAALGKDALSTAIEQNSCRTVMTSSNQLQTVKDAIAEGSSLRMVIQVDEEKVADIPGCQILSLSTIENYGRGKNITSTKTNWPEPKDIAVMIYTSGSTGVPKGVLISHANLLAAIVGLGACVPGLYQRKLTAICYLPLAHIFELDLELFCYMAGIRVGYSSPQTLSDRSPGIRKGQIGDLQALRPHLMISVPMVLDRIYNAVRQSVHSYGFAGKKLFYSTLLYKQAMRQRGWNTPLVDRLLSARLNRSIFGGNLRTLIVGGATLDSEVQNFFQNAMCVNVYRGYGITEACGAGAVSDANDRIEGSVGAPAPSVEIRLRNWEEGGYRNTDRPEPRGEVLLGGPTVAVGYAHASPEETRNFININGVPYFCTGDIGKILPNGALSLIDRKKDLVKVKRGQYVSLAKVENAALLSPVVEFCCAIVHSTEDVVLLVAPNEEALKSYAEQIGLEKGLTLAELCANGRLGDKLLEKMIGDHMKDRLEKFETPVKVILVADKWLPGSNLLTASMRVRRRSIEQTYKSVIEQAMREG